MLTIPAAQLPTCPGPSTALPTPLSVGTLYTFVNPGDQIPMHAHPDGTTHLTVVAFGEVVYTVQDAQGVQTSTTYQAPALINVPVNVMHSFTGVTSGSVVFNLLSSRLDPAAIKSMIGNAVTCLQNALTAAQNAQSLTV